VKFRSLLITGTDTGVGKTSIGCALAAALTARRLKVGVFKPAETGCPADAGKYHPHDAALLRYFSESQAEIETVCPYALREPLAPLVAARRAQVEIRVDVIADAYRRISLDHDLTLVEGAGGLLVPIAPGIDYAGLAARLDLPIVVVVASRLGAINHALLTIRYARTLGLRIVGYIVNFPKADADIAADTNIDVLHELLGPPLGVLPFLGPIEANAATRKHLAAEMEKHLRVEDLLLPLNS
jgi:dethiobiotin synthetase